MTTEPLTLFTFGYEGWGSATKHLVVAVDAVEAARGFKPPLFVDIRLSRSVRAPGFIGTAFEKAVGSERYRWLDSLGNANIKQGGPIRIQEPAAAETLLEIAENCIHDKRRVIFFCHCHEPCSEGQPICHRATVAGLVLDVARQKHLTIRIIEWPGGEPRLEKFEIQLSPAAFEKVYKGASTFPLEEPFSLAEMAAVPWGSLVDIRNTEDHEDIIGPFVTGPAQYKFKSKSAPGRWCLPKLGFLEKPRDEIPGLIHGWRQWTGYEPRQS